MLIQSVTFQGFLKQIGTLYASYTTYQIQNGFFHSTMAKTPFSFIRSYSMELQPQLSTNLIGIMEQRLLAIEHRKETSLFVMDVFKMYEKYS
uniref:Uncharacterized protein n=1 Tax=Vitis vinifera TaxID=29760 RepID=F6HTR9_VITVI